MYRKDQQANILGTVPLSFHGDDGGRFVVEVEAVNL
jgi:hypothetical protein